MIKNLLITCTSLMVSVALYAQHTYIPIGANEQRLADRLETFGGFVSKDFNSALKPYARVDVTGIAGEYMEYYQLNINEPTNKLDVFNAKRAIDISGEWGKPNHMYPDAARRREKPILRYFFETESNFLMHSNDDFFFVLNPVVYMQGGLENNRSDVRFISLRGAEARAKIFNKIGVYTFLAENQERMPLYQFQKARQWNAYPGFDYFTVNNSQIFDGFMTRAYIDFPIYKNNINATFGFDKNFIGDGMRSLFLSNSGAPYTFLRLRYAFGNFTYQQLIMELMRDYHGANDVSIPKKYASVHYLGLNLGSKFTLGLFESTIFNRVNGIEPMAFVPVIYANTAVNRLAQHSKGHQSNIGLSFKAVPWRYIQFYGQGLMQDVDFNNFGDGSWKNQYAAQLGFKYFNVAKVKNMDLQLEWNMARPFMYASNNGVSNYSHYNQPLAHPMENGFHEFIGALSFQPGTKLTLDVKAIYSLKNTRDSMGNNGIGIFDPINTRIAQNGFHFFDRNIDKAVYFNLHGAYEVFQNFYIDFGLTQMTTERFKLSSNSFLFYGGIRWNMQRREYDFN